ncbi:MAG: TIGR04141 family sporadically distributed protein [Actinobacteria bacterium]|nr:TIGR04141 family sporadically distributed protein [Actinomycetota bacterium]
MNPPPPRRRRRKQRLTWFLLKDGMDVDDILRDRSGLRELKLDTGAVLFVASRPPTEPGWTAYVKPHLHDELGGVWSASSSAVMLVGAGGRTFALIFGYGRSLLAADAYEQDFGLKVVLNTVAFDQIKSVDARTIDDNTLHTRRDVSRDSSFEAFGLDVTRDLVRAVTGTSTADDLNGKLTGSDALALHTHARVPELPALAERLLAAYEDTAYQQHFDFIDYLRIERRPDVIERLQGQLLAALRAGALDDVHLAIPEPLNWLDVAGIRFSSQRRGDALDTDPRISVYLRTRDAAELSVERLRRDYVEAMSASDDLQKLQSWSVYRCLVFETQDGEHLYTLSGGEWYRVALTFKDEVYDFVERLPILDLELPLASFGVREEVYIQDAAAATGTLPLDQRLVRRSVPDPIEICDLLTSDGTFVHLKKRGKSSTLSHLFAQGLVSAELLLQNPRFRDEAREIIRGVDPAFEGLIPDGRPARGEYEVAYVVMTRSNRDSPLTLPFFSLVSLRAAALRLENIGMSVSVGKVNEARPG